MLVARLVVSRERLLQDLSDHFSGNGSREKGDRLYVDQNGLERVQRTSSITLCMGHERFNSLGREAYISLLPSPFHLHFQSPLEHGADVLVRERFQNKHPAPGQQGSGKLEARVL